jgi:NADH dehydrogenase
MKQKRVLIVGGGFAGIKAALELSADKRLQVSLLSNRPTFRYYPGLHVTATGGLPLDSSIPLNEILDGKPVKLIIGEAVQLDRQDKTIITSRIDSYDYDILIMALGVVTNFWQIKGLEKNAFSIKSNEEVMRFKNHLHQQLIDESKPDLNYIIVGGGPTGVEIAGALPGYLKKIMDRHNIKHRAIRVELIESANRILPQMPASMSKKVAKRLRKLGIKLYLGKGVEGETAERLKIKGKSILSHTVVWTAGVTNHPFFKVNKFKINDNGKVIVNEYLQAEDNIYVLGDNADTPYSGMAQTGLHDAMHVSANIIRQLDGKPARAYKPEQPVYIIPVGPYWAAVNWRKLKLYGWLGWMLRQTFRLVAFHYYEPWWKASEQWIKEFETFENCPVCASQI